MKNKIILIAFTLMLFAGTASASNMWGTYKGNAVIRVTVNGVPLKVDDVPAINYNSRTLVPISMLRQLGVNVTWDGKNQTTDVKMPTMPTSTSIDIRELSKKLKKNNIEFVNYITDGEEFNHIVFTYNFDLDDSKFPDDLDAMLLSIYHTEVSMVSVYDAGNYELSMHSADVNSYLEKKSELKDLLDHSRLIDPSGNVLHDPQNTSSAGQNNTSVTPVSKELPKLYSNDGKTYLGTLTSNKYDSDSIYNNFGDYGSEFSKTSIWNKFGDYGSEFSINSAFNKFATKPPIIILDGKIVGYLTINSTLTGAISPYDLSKWLEDNNY